MKRTNKNVLLGALIATVVLALVAGCNDIARSSSPVRLVVTNTQEITRIDLQPGAANCDANIATVNVQAILLASPTNTNLPVDDRFNDVRLTSYRVSYQRRDGGTLVPAPFTRSTSGLLTTGGAASSLNDFEGFEIGAITQAPFAALTPSGGGRDPETGKDVVTMDAILEVFGETLAGERVSGSTRLTLNFCYACNGCN